MPRRSFYNTLFHVTSVSQPFAQRNIYLTSSAGFEEGSDQFKFTLALKTKLLNQADTLIKRIERNGGQNVIWTKLNFLLEKGKLGGLYIRIP